MDYSEISFQIQEDQERFPGTVRYLVYPRAEAERSVFIRPVSFSLQTQSAGTVYSCDFKNCYLLFYCQDGDGRLGYKEKSFPFGKEMGFFLDGDDLSEILAGEDGAKYTLYSMTGLLAEELLHIAEEKNAFSFEGDQFHDFEQRQFLLVRSFPGKLKGKEYDFSCHMNHLLVRILQLGPETSSAQQDDHRQMIQQVLTWVQAHFSENISITELAAQFHYSPSQFQKCFQEQTHCSAKQYLIRIRMQEAEKLLTDTNLPVEEVCTRCGFNNANHFIRVFRQYYGKTPLQYRKGKKRSTP